MDYLIDGTLTGLMSVMRCLDGDKKNHLEDHILEEASYQMSILTPFTSHCTHEAEALAFMDALAQELGEHCMRAIMSCYLSEDKARFDAIKNFIITARTLGRHCYMNHTDPGVYPLLKLEQAVERERHKFLGLLRFKRLKGDIYYASFAPSYDISMLLADHFSERLNDQYFIIHDLKREKAIFYNKKSWVMGDLAEVQELYHQEELAFQSFWQKYHKHIAIAERKNPRLQMQFMPKKYWDYLTEMQSS